MSLWNFQKCNGDTELKALQNTVDELINKISWLSNNIDSKNVKRLDTNETSIKSANGETYINGPILEMYDNQASPVLRLRQGLDTSTSTFIFELFNKSGVKTVGIDSNGDATFTGSISASDISGSSFSTYASGDTNYIKIDDTGFMGYEKVGSAWELNGLVISSTAWADTYWYYGGYKFLGIKKDISNVSFRNYYYDINDVETEKEFLYFASEDVGAGVIKSKTYASGEWYFLSGTCNVNGLVTDTEANHNHGISSGTWLATSSDGITVDGHVWWTPSGGHSHSVTT